MSFQSNQAKQFAMTTFFAHDYTNYNKIIERAALRTECNNITVMCFNKNIYILHKNIKIEIMLIVPRTLLNRYPTVMNGIIL